MRALTVPTWMPQIFRGVGYIQFLDLAQPDNLPIFRRQVCKDIRHDAGSFLSGYILLQD